MATVKGQLFKVYEKQWQNKVLRSLKLEDNPIYYRWGDKPLPAGVVSGAFLEFNAEPKDDKSAQIKGDITIATKPTAAAGASAAPTSVGSPGREASIHYQSAQKFGVEMAKAVFPLVVGKAKPADQVGIFEGLVDKYTALAFADIANFGAVARANGAAEASEPTPGAEEDEE